MTSSINDLSRGYLMYAHNNPSIDYGSLALANALLIKKVCKKVKNVALVTDEGTLDWLLEKHGDDLLDTAFDQVLLDNMTADRTSGTRRYHDTRYTSFSDLYHNANRLHANDVSPYDETILLDVDYIILDDTLDLVWGSKENIMCNTKTFDLDHKPNGFGFDNRFNDMSIPLYWATVLYFRKSPESNLIFNLMEFVKEHYNYYQYLYRFMPSGYFRNDYALSIAIHITNNFMEYNGIAPLPIDHVLFSLEHDEVHAFKDGKIYITSESEQGNFILHSCNRNVHMMNKRAVSRHVNEIIKYATE